MDLPAIIVKITGVILLLWTIRSIYRHFTQRKTKTETVKGKIPQNAATSDKKPSFTEQLLNNLLLYLWLAFMVTFSTGMVLNN
jgi:beta-lactamase regulating signal transducer with metallopeptidase domain